jgi:hypothetical protein
MWTLDTWKKTNTPNHVHICNASGLFLFFLSYGPWHVRVKYNISYMLRKLF